MKRAVATTQPPSSSADPMEPELALVAGLEGRLIRGAQFIAFCSRYDPDLHEVIATGLEGSLFKMLATHVVTRQFVSVPDFVAIDLQAETFFLFGDLEIELDGESVSGAESTTWVERPTGVALVISCGSRAGEQPAGTRLDAGSVPAGGFVLDRSPAERAGGTSAQNEVTLADELTKAGEALTRTTQTAATRATGEPPSSADDADEGGLDILADPDIDLETLGAPGRGKPSAGPAPDTPGPCGPNDSTGTGGDEQDISEDETEDAGAADPQDEPRPTPSPRSHDESVASGEESETDDEFEPGNDRQGDTHDDGKAAGEDGDLVDVDVGVPSRSIRRGFREAPVVGRSATVETVSPSRRAPTRGFRKPGEPIEVNSDPTEAFIDGEETSSATGDSRRTSETGKPSEMVSTARVRLDDGRTFDIDAGLVVGRYPEKRKIPAGYATLTVEGADVSRVHLRLWVAEGHLLALDCQTANGSVLAGFGGRRDLSSDDGHELTPGERLEFGSRTLEFIGWVEDA